MPFNLGHSELFIPALHFGSLREMTISFYLSIDSLGEENIEKRFGFHMGNVEVFFIPECDITMVAC